MGTAREALAQRIDFVVGLWRDGPVRVRTQGQHQLPACASRCAAARYTVGYRDSRLGHRDRLDADNDGAVTWGELKAARSALFDYAVSHLHVSSANASCPLMPQDLKVVSHSDGAYAVLLFRADCEGPTRELAWTTACYSKSMRCIED